MDQEKSALVLGGTGAVGRQLISELSAEGWRVEFTYSENDALASNLSKECGAKGHRFSYGRTILPSGKFDAVVCTIGVILDKEPGLQASLETVEKTINVNSLLPIEVSKAYAKSMIEQEWGRFVFLGSIYSYRVTTNNLAYNTSKHALSGVVKTLALENAKFGLTFNEVCPSAITSDIMSTIAARKEAEGVCSAQEFLNMVSEANPTGRMADPKDVSAAIRFLISDQAGFINGISLPVDGGQTLE